MSDEAALLAAIRASPEDDTPRLAYADWLQEHDRTDRAEFIRAQIELPQLPDDDPRRGDLEIAERRLLAKHAVEWSAPWPPFTNWEYAGDTPLRTVFRRGFLDELDGWGVPPDIGGDLFARVCAAHPIRSLSAYWYFPAILSAFVARLELRSLDSLALQSYAHHGAMAAQRRENVTQLSSFLRHADLSRLRRLTLGVPGLREEAVAEWLRLPLARRLVAFHVVPSGIPMDGESLRVLMRRKLPDLRELSVGGRGPDYVRALNTFVESEVWNRLTDAVVYGGRFPWASALEGSRLARLTVHVHRPAEVDALAAGLASAPVSLEELTLHGDHVHGEALSRLLAACGATNLRRLALRQSFLPDDDLARLAAAPVLAHLNRLAVWRNSPAGANLEALFAADLSRMTHLRVNWGSVPPAARRALARNGSARRLRVLSLGVLTDADELSALTSGEPFPELHTVRFSFWRPPPTPATLDAFLNSPKLPRLCVVPFGMEDADVGRLGPVFKQCERLAWAGGEMIDGGDGTRVSVVPETVYLPNHLDDLEA